MVSRLSIPSTLPPAAAERLNAAGSALYGGRWQSGLADALGVARTTIVRWNSGEVAPPADLDAKLALAARKRAAEMYDDASRMIRLAEYLEDTK